MTNVHNCWSVYHVRHVALLLKIPSILVTVNSQKLSYRLFPILELLSQTNHPKEIVAFLSRWAEILWKLINVTSDCKKKRSYIFLFKISDKISTYSLCTVRICISWMQQFFMHLTQDLLILEKVEWNRFHCHMFIGVFYNNLKRK